MKRTNAKIEEEHDHHDEGFRSGQYMTELFQVYRNMTMNFCCAFLVFSLYLTSYFYEVYRPIKEKADEINKKLGKKVPFD